ncbi:MAG TPA: cytochrome C oxidase subunit IV family protein [Isosphaeraceae bacterium]|nr:cytochrome C oxidase subunit IV family protein [Isosphaeraceae bacterium]
MSQHVISKQTNYVVFGILMLLLVATVAVAEFDLGSMNLFIAMFIATVKAALIILYFMHVRYSSPLTGFLSVAAFVWLGIMLILTANDYVTRGWLLIDGK